MQKVLILDIQEITSEDFIPDEKQEILTMIYIKFYHEQLFISFNLIIFIILFNLYQK